MSWVSSWLGQDDDDGDGQADGTGIGIIDNTVDTFNNIAGGLGVSPELLAGGLFGGIPGVMGVGAAQGIGDALKPPDYSGPEGMARKALDDEKRRRATEANRRDLQASQLARLFLSDSGAQDETFNFMGL